MSDFDVEKKADELLTALGKELAKSRVAYADAVLDENTPTPPFYQELPRKKKTGTRRVFRRTLILVAVLALIMGLVVISSEGVREKMFNYFFTEKPGHTEVRPLENEEKEGELPEFELGYVPEGYEKINDEDVWDYGYIIDYGNDKEQYINFMVTKSDVYSASFDNDTLKRKEIMINTYQAYLFYDDKSSAVIWQIGDYVLELFTESSIDVAVKMAENVYFKND
mgnify:CR=1 FL=1